MESAHRAGTPAPDSLWKWHSPPPPHPALVSGSLRSMAALPVFPATPETWTSEDMPLRPTRAHPTRESSTSPPARPWPYRKFLSSEYCELSSMPTILMNLKLDLPVPSRLPPEAEPPTPNHAAPPERQTAA